MKKIKSLNHPLDTKTRLWHRCFPVNFSKFQKFLKTLFLQNTSGLLLLGLAIHVQFIICVQDACARNFLGKNEQNFLNIHISNSSENKMISGINCKFLKLVFFSKDQLRTNNTWKLVTLMFWFNWFYRWLSEEASTKYVLELAFASGKLDQD